MNHALVESPIDSRAPQEIGKLSAVECVCGFTMYLREGLLQCETEGCELAFRKFKRPQVLLIPAEVTTS